MWDAHHFIHATEDVGAEELKTVIPAIAAVRSRGGRVRTDRVIVRKATAGNGGLASARMVAGPEVHRF
jgi:hypothetical protein